jgi:hypothetical protein
MQGFRDIEQFLAKLVNALEPLNVVPPTAEILLTHLRLVGYPLEALSLMHFSNEYDSQFYPDRFPRSASADRKEVSE